MSKQNRLMIVGAVFIAFGSCWPTGAAKARDASAFDRKNDQFDSAVAAWPSKKQPEANAPPNSAGSGEKRVVNGLPAAAGQFPWQVAIIRANAPEGRPFAGLRCGGTLIEWRWILTAAHCVYSRATLLRPDQLNVYVGSVNFEGGRRVAVSQVIPKEDYDPRTMDNDVALIELATRLQPSDGVALIRLGEVAGRSAIVVGWGSTLQGVADSKMRRASQGLQYGNLEFKADFECNRNYVAYFRENLASQLKAENQSDRSIRQQLDESYPASARLITGNMFCAGPRMNSLITDSCFGDSGGPLVIPGKDGYLQVGVVSWGPDDGCGLSDLFGVYANVAVYTSWINSKIH